MSAIRRDLPLRRPPSRRSLSSGRGAAGIQNRGALAVCLSKALPRDGTPQQNKLPQNPWDTARVYCNAARIKKK
jgi:hypothetical protein